MCFNVSWLVLIQKREAKEVKDGFLNRHVTPYGPTTGNTMYPREIIIYSIPTEIF